MMKSDLRNKVTDTMDDIEGRVQDILEDLRMVEDEASMDVEALDHSEIGELQSAVLEAITALKELADELY